MNRSSIIIIGSSGMLGRELLTECNRRDMDVCAFAGRKDLDITDADAVRDALRNKAPAVVINAAGYTDVDRAEAEPGAADQVNRAGPGHVAQVCSEIGALLVHYSTDYVFDGRAGRPYRVDDTPRPINTYGSTKLAGERAVVESGCAHLLIRTSWLFAPHGRNFVRRILELARQRPTLHVVHDQCGRPTYAADLAVLTLKLLAAEARGIFHVANDGECTWYEFAKGIVETADLECRVMPCKTIRFLRPAKRPGFSVLDLTETVNLIGRPRHWSEALQACLADILVQDRV